MWHTVYSLKAFHLETVDNILAKFLQHIQLDIILNVRCAIWEHLGLLAEVEDRCICFMYCSYPSDSRTNDGANHADINTGFRILGTWVDWYHVVVYTVSV